VQTNPNKYIGSLLIPFVRSSEAGAWRLPWNWTVLQSTCWGLLWLWAALRSMQIAPDCVQFKSVIHSICYDLNADLMFQRIWPRIQSNTCMLILSSLLIIESQLQCVKSSSYIPWRLCFLWQMQWMYAALYDTYRSLTCEQTFAVYHIHQPQTQ
jgi:hypothetical protein